MHDPIVEEIRRVREAHAASFHFDLDAIFADLKKRERQSRRKVVSLPAKPPQRATPAKSANRA
jgi:hypothetical protein